MRSERSIILAYMDLQDGKIMKLSSSDSSKKAFNNVDENLLVEIIGRLPSREAFRLKLVCKRWCSLISSDYFITFFNHRRHDSSLPPIRDPHSSSSSSSSFIFQFQCPYRYHCLRIVRCGVTHHDADSCGVRILDLSFLPAVPKHRIELKASCADLILLCSTRTKSRTEFFYVCNQLTKRWAALPRAPIIQEEAVGFLCVPASCSLCRRGSDNSRCNFMVVRIFLVPLGIPVSQYKVQLFSSQVGHWQTLLVSSPRTLICKVHKCEYLVPYKGMLHWLFSKFILVYDPYNSPETFSRVIDLSFGEYFVQNFGVFQDCLRVIGRSWDIQDGAYYIWELEDYNIGKWSLVHKIDTTSLQLLAPHLSIKLTGFGQIDGSVFYNSKSYSTCIGNIPSGRMDHQYELIHHGAHGFFFPPFNVHWIANQRWPTPVPSLRHTIKSKKRKDRKKVKISDSEPNKIDIVLK